MRYNRKTVNIITPAVNKAVSVADMKEYLRVDTADDDVLIGDFIDASTESVKQYIRRSLITETLELSMDGFNSISDDNLVALGSGVHYGSRPYILGRGDEIDIPFLPVQSITTLKTFNRSNVESTFDASNYELDEIGGRLYLNEGITFPVELRNREAVKLRYVSGYGDDSTDIPTPIIQVIKQHVAKMYDCREMCDLSNVCKTMLAPYKLFDELGYC